MILLRLLNLFRVGAKDRGTRFLSFVDTMLGYRHLLTVEDLNKAASMCSSLKGVLRSRFLVLSDDRDPPPPPARGKRSHPDGDHPPAAGGKRLQTRSQANQGQAVPTQPNQSQAAPTQTNPSTRHPASGHQFQVQAQVNSHPSQDASADPARVSQAPPSLHVQSVQEEVHILSVGQHNTSTPFQQVKNRRNRRLPAGVKAITKPVRTTPDRQAKANRVPAQAVPLQPDPDGIDLDIDLDVSPTGSVDMEGSSGESSTNTVVDWVRFA